MTINITLNSVGNLQDTTTAQNVLSSNNATITGGFTTALNITGDQMQGTLDMNSNQVINLPAPGTAQSPVRLIDISSSSNFPTISSFSSSSINANFIKVSTLEVDIGGVFAGISSTSPVVLPRFTVTTLPVTQAGGIAVVTDATATTYGTVVTGGSTNVVTVFYTGTAWHIG